MTEVSTEIIEFANAIRDCPTWPPANRDDWPVWADPDQVPDVISVLAAWGAQKNNADTHVLMPQRYGFDAQKVRDVIVQRVIIDHPREALLIGQVFSAALNGDPELAGMLAVTLQDANVEEQGWAILAAADLYRKLVVPRPAPRPKPGPRR